MGWLNFHCTMSVLLDCTRSHFCIPVTQSSTWCCKKDGEDALTVWRHSCMAWKPPSPSAKVLFLPLIIPRSFPCDVMWNPTSSEATKPSHWDELSGFAYREKWWGIWSTLGTAVPQLLPPRLQASTWCCPIAFCNLGKREKQMVEQTRVVSAGGSRGTGAEQSSCAKACGAYHLSAGTFRYERHGDIFFKRVAFSFPSPWNSALVVSVIFQKSAQKEQQTGARTRQIRVNREQCPFWDEKGRNA